MAESAAKQPRQYIRSEIYVRAKPGLRLRDRKVSRLAARVKAAVPWLQASDWPAVRAWCELEILSQQAYAVLRAGGILNADGSPRRMISDYRQLRMAQAALTRELGMTPMARQALQYGKDGGIDIVAAMARVAALPEDEPEQPSEPVLPETNSSNS
jgi:hypothetical protein